MNAERMAAILRVIAAPDTSESDRWIMRVALLETAGIGVDADSLATIGGCDTERAEGAIGVLMANDMVEDDQPEASRS